MAKDTKSKNDNETIEIGEITINELIVSDPEDLAKLGKMFRRTGVQAAKKAKAAKKEAKPKPKKAAVKKKAKPKPKPAKKAKPVKKAEPKKPKPKKVKVAKPKKVKVAKPKPVKKAKPVKRVKSKPKPKKVAPKKVITKPKPKKVAKPKPVAKKAAPKKVITKPKRRIMRPKPKPKVSRPALDKPVQLNVNPNQKNVGDNDRIDIAIREIDINQTTSTDFQNKYSTLELSPITDTGVKALKQVQKRQKQLTSRYSKEILEGKIISTTNYQPNINQHVIELNDVTKSYLTGDIETQVLKGINIKLDKSDFIVILGPSGSGKTTFLNTISGLDKATKGDVFVLGYNLTLLKDSHLTKFRRKHVGFIFQQYNLLTNLTAKENAEVGENLAENKNADMSIEEIFETIGMKDQMDKYPHQMSGGQQQRVSIARALAKNPDLLFADEPTGALDEEMGRKVLQILVTVNKKYKTTIVVVTHNPNIAKIGNTVIHIKNGLIDKVIKNEHPADPATIDWS